MDPKLFKAFPKAFPNNKGYNDTLQKTMQNFYGAGVDIHAMIGKLPTPKKGRTPPSHKYTGPYNPP